MASPLQCEHQKAFIKIHTSLSLSLYLAQWPISDQILQTVPSDQHLNRLAAQLGSEWELVMLDLGLTWADISRCRTDHPHSSHNQVLEALMMWKQTQGRRATVQRLLQSLQNSEIHPYSLKQLFYWGCSIKWKLPHPTMLYVLCVVYFIWLLSFFCYFLILSDRLLIYTINWKYI